jgi:hypothetical protein
LTRARVFFAVLMLWTASGLCSGVAVSAEQRNDAFVCPMHPDVRSSDQGTCAICGMALVAIAPSPAARTYGVEIRTSPEAVVPGSPFQLRLTVRDSTTGAVVDDFVEVHEKRFHLFVISQNLEHYAHLHPEQDDDGSWLVDVAVPHAGYYKIYSDFLPEGGTPQVVARAFVTAGFGGTLASSSARLVPDRSLHKTVDGMTVALAVAEGGLVAGREETFTYRLTDAATGAPVDDIEPYLGAWGHSLVISEDTNHVVHAHPIESLHGGNHDARGGPTLTFKALLPNAGNYRIWTQIRRRGQVSTAVFTVAVAPGGSHAGQKSLVSPAPDHGHVAGGPGKRRPE